MQDMRIIDGAAVRRATPMPALIAALADAFTRPHVAPPRAMHALSATGSLLLMPAWHAGGDVGVKVATVQRTQSPAVQASYLLLDGTTGRPKALIDGAMLTARRTAAASALAARYLARADADTLLLVGTGALVPHLIEAYAAIRPLRRVTIWGRDAARAGAAVDAARAAGYPAEAAGDLASAVAGADIVSCATLATTPLIRGAILRPGQHLDLIGAFTPQMAEADPDCFARAEVFVDMHEGALEEAGDLLQAIAAGAFAASDIRADLAGLCAGAQPGRTDPKAITLFKSVGAAIEDLAAAGLVYRAVTEA